MNILYFKYAIEVEKSGSISKAAANLYIAQPNLSKAIKDLEEELGYAVFERTSTGVKVTEKGDAFVAEMNMKNGTEITLNETNAIRTIDNVADRGYNMGIIRYPESEESFFTNRLKNNHLLSETIWEFEYVLVMARTHPLAMKEEITPDDLNHYTQITHGDIELPGEKNLKAVGGTDNANKNVIYVYERGSQFDLLANVPTTYIWISCK